MNSLVLCLLSLAVVGLVSGSAWIALRRHRYCRELKYDPRQDFVLGVAPKSVETVSIVCDSTGFMLPELSANAVTVFLELRLQHTATGLVFDPSVEISWETFCDKQFFERGVHGIRFLNLTRLIRAGAKAGARVILRGLRVTWLPAGGTSLVVCYESVRPDDRVLVVSPHPDDAELGAFGLYA